MTGVRCPKDSNWLRLRETERYSGFICEECRGVWLTLRHFHAIDYARNFSYDEFSEALDAAPKIFTSLPCPAGCGALVQANWLEEPLCWCPACRGVWFDNRAVRELRQRASYSQPADFSGTDYVVVGDAVAQVLLTALAFFSC